LALIRRRLGRDGAPARAQAVAQFRVTTVSRRSLETAQAAAAKVGIPNAVATTPELVNRPDVELVVIRCGTSRRYRQWYNRGRRIRERR